MYRIVLVSLLGTLLAGPVVQAQDKEFDKAVTKVEASFHPAEA